MASLLADTVVEVSDGEVALRTRAEVEARFASYFDEATFLEWSDLDPPVAVVARSGDLATVRVRRRVRAGYADSVGTTRLDHRVFAWTERWERTTDRWRLAAVTSTDRPGRADVAGTERTAEPAPGAEGRSAEEVLERARALVEVRARLPADSVRSLALVAEGASPRGSFRTALRSHGDGRISLAQRTTSGELFERAVGPVGGAPDPDPVRAFLQGHALLHLAVDPEAVLGAGRWAGAVRFAGVAADVLTFRDGAGSPLDLLYARDSGHLLGIRVRAPGARGSGPPEVILIYLSGWRESDGLRLPRRAAFLEGEDLFLYRLRDVRVNEASPGDVGDLLAEGSGTSRRDG